jgi:hypothetical protein
MRDQRLGAGDIGRRPRGCGLGIDARGAFNGKEPFEAF